MRPIVIKIGGDLIGKDDLLKDIVSLGDVQLVLVHGGGGEVSRWLERLGIETSFIAGYRVTDEKALSVVIAVLCGLINKQLVWGLLRAGARAIGISGIDSGLIKAERKEGVGYVGEIRKVNPKIVLDLLEMGYLPVISPTGAGEDSPLNINADNAAAEIAISLNAKRLIFLTNTDGVLDRDKKTILRLDKETSTRLIGEGVISGGMALKIEAGFKALSFGIPVSIINGKIPGALPKEIREPGFGTILEG